MRRVLAAIVSSGVLLGFPGALGAQAPIVTHPPTDLAVLIEGAVKARLGAGFTVRAHVVEPTPPSGEFVTASPDPMGRLGKEIIFTLTPVAGTGRPARVRAQVDVSGPHVEARGEVLRGHEVDVASAATVDGPVVGVPVKRLPELSQIIGQKALRPIGAGQVIESGFVALRPAVEPGENDLQLLSAYDWPGNIRELQNTIERLKILAENHEIKLEDLPFNIRVPKIRSEFAEGSVEAPLEEVEDRAVDRAVVRAVEVVRLEDLRDLGHRVAVDEERAEHRLLGFDRLRGKTVDGHLGSRATRCAMTDGAPSAPE